LNSDCLLDKRRIKKFHILSMWSVIDSFDAAYRRKTTRVKRAQYLAAFAVVLLFVTLLKVTWRFGTI